MIVWITFARCLCCPRLDSAEGIDQVAAAVNAGCAESATVGQNVVVQQGDEAWAARVRWSLETAARYLVQPTGLA